MSFNLGLSDRIFAPLNVTLCSHEASWSSGSAVVHTEIQSGIPAWFDSLFEYKFPPSSSLGLDCDIKWKKLPEVDLRGWSNSSCLWETARCSGIWESVRGWSDEAFSTHFWGVWCPSQASGPKSIGCLMGWKDTYRKQTMADSIATLFIFFPLSPSTNSNHDTE